MPKLAGPHGVIWMRSDNSHLITVDPITFLDKLDMNNFRSHVLNPYFVALRGKAQPPERSNLWESSDKAEGLLIRNYQQPGIRKIRDIIELKEEQILETEKVAVHVRFCVGMIKLAPQGFGLQPSKVLAVLGVAVSVTVEPAV